MCGEYATRDQRQRKFAVDIYPESKARNGVTAKTEVECSISHPLHLLTLVRIIYHDSRLISARAYEHNW